MSEGRLRTKLVCELGVLLVELLGCQLLRGVIRLVSDHLLELYRSQSISLRNQYIHSFNIIGVLWFLLLELGC